MSPQAGSHWHRLQPSGLQRQKHCVFPCMLLQYQDFLCVCNGTTGYFQGRVFMLKKVFTVIAGSRLY